MNGSVYEILEVVVIVIVVSTQIGNHISVVLMGLKQNHDVLLLQVVSE